MRRKTIETPDFVRQVFVRSRGHGDVEDPYSKGIFVRPEDIVTPAGERLPQHTLQRLWNRAIKEKYAFRETEHVYVPGGKNVCATYKLDRAKIITDLGDSLWIPSLKPQCRDSWKAIESLSDISKCTLMGNKKEGKNKVPGKEASRALIDEVDPEHFYVIDSEALSSVNEAIDHPSSRLSWSVDVKIKRNKAAIASRMTSGNCSVRKKERRHACPHLFGDGAKEYDIRSTVPAVVRLLRTGKWLESKQDLKKDVLAKSGTKLSMKKLKSLMLPMMFNPTEAMAWRTFSYRTKNHESLRVSREEFKRVHAAMMELVGPNEWEGTIFFHESAIELLTIRNIQNEGEFLGSVYDCFFYRGLTESQVEDCVARAAIEYYEDTFKPRLGARSLGRRATFSGLLSRRVVTL